MFLSAVVVLEVAVKRSLGKLDAPERFAEVTVALGASPLPIGLAHAERIETLPWHHRDPFDRLLVAQAMVEGAVLVSRDDVMGRYGVPVIW